MQKLNLKVICIQQFWWLHGDKSSSEKTGVCFPVDVQLVIQRNLDIMV